MNIFIVEFQKKKETLKYSRVLLKYLLSNFYKKDSQILEDNGKPYIDDELHFSISHSQNILVIAFDEYPIGIDIEYSLKDRKYNDLLKQMGCEATRDISKEEFYKIWTIYEADFKSSIHQENICFKYKDYICSLSSRTKSIPAIYEVKIPKNKIIESELINLKLTNDNAQKENSVVIQEIVIASSELLSLPTLKIE